MDPLSLRMASLALLSSPMPLLASIPRPPSLPGLHLAILDQMLLVIEFCQDVYVGLQTAGFHRRGTIILAHRLLRASTACLWAAWTQELEPHEQWSEPICILLRAVQLGPLALLPLPASPDPPGPQSLPQARAIIQASRLLARASPAVLRRLQRPLALAPHAQPRPRASQVLEAAASSAFFPQGVPVDDTPQAHATLLSAARVLSAAPVSDLWFAATWHRNARHADFAQPWMACQSLLMWTLASAPHRDPDPWVEEVAV